MSTDGMTELARLLREYATPEQLRDLRALLRALEQQESVTPAAPPEPPELPAGFAGFQFGGIVGGLLGIAFGWLGLSPGIWRGISVLAFFLVGGIIGRAMLLADEARRRTR